MNRIDRLFGILTLLQSKKYLSAEAIASQFGISIRTVYRDIRALSKQGVPLSFEPHKGYFIVDGYFLPPISFNSEEASALLLMEKMLPGFSDRSIQQHYLSALNKVKAVLRGTQKEQLERLNTRMMLQLPAGYNQGLDYLSSLQQAISEQCIVELSYKNNKEEASLRKVEPIGLIFYAFHWHLIAWCHLREAYRDFRVSRIEALQLTKQGFSKAEHMPIQEYMKQLPVDY